MSFKLLHINEPLLTFGYQQKTIDPRDGIMLFGPFSQSTINTGNFGVIGTPDGIRRIKEWLEKIKKPIVSVNNDIARPFFPGIESAYGITVNIDALQEIVITDKTINEALRYKDKHQRTSKLVNIYADPLISYTQEQEIPVTVWFVVIPEEIYLYGRPQSRAPSTADITIGKITKEERQNIAIFDELNEQNDAYKYEVNFHNQLKAKLLPSKVITQIIREKKIAYRELFTSQYQIDNEAKFDSAKAWNICNALYYKCGGLPWKLGSVRKHVCYVGLVYKKLDENSDDKTACCAAQMFLDSGDGLVFRGNVGPWYNPTLGEYHLSKESAEELLTKALETFKKNNGEYPAEMFIHAKTFFDDLEWAGFEKASAGKSKIVGVRIRSDNNLKLYREETYAVPRGTYAVMNELEAYLWTKGFIPRIQTQMGLETPNPLNVKIIRGESDIHTVCSDVLSLTKLNYNTCIYADGAPVTLKFADMIGEVLTAGPMENIDVLPFKHYI